MKTTAKKTTAEKVTENIVLCPDGKYRWVYEYSMLKNPVILITIFKVLGIAALIVLAFILGIDLIEDGHLTPPASGELKVLGILILVLIGLVIISYLIVAAMYGWKYIVLFEMDEGKVVHIQMPKQVEKAQAAGWLSAMAGLAVGNVSAAGPGLLAASHSTSTSVFRNVRTVSGSRRFHTIKVNQRLDKNQVYAEDADYDFVWEYITKRCVNAKKR